jgi:hypothetical protein
MFMIETNPAKTVVWSSAMSIRILSARKLFFPFSDGDGVILEDGA